MNPCLRAALKENEPKDPEQRLALLAVEYITECEKLSRNEEYISLLYRDMKQAVIDLKGWYKE